MLKFTAFLVIIVLIGGVDLEKVFMQQLKDSSSKIRKNDAFAPSTTIKTTTTTKPSPIDRFRQHVSTLHRAKEENYYCTTHTNTSQGLTWVLRNKKCLDLNATTRMSFSAAYDYCEKKIPFSYRAHILHRNELQALLSASTNRANNGDVGLDLISLYSNLGVEFSLWLNNNDFSDCSNRDETPVFIYNQDRCRKGCFECATKLANSRHVICVKPCGWRVDLNSYCNTMNVTHVENNPNLYVQRENQLYVCKGDLICADNFCQCPRGKKFVKEKSKCI